MENPLKRARESQNLTQEDIANRAVVGVQTVKKLEWGLFTTVNPAVLGALTAVGDRPGTSHAQIELERLYREWVISRRQEMLIPTRENISACRGWVSWIEFREMFSRSQVGFCKLFCMTPQVLQTWERGFDKGLDRTRFTPYMYQMWLEVGLSDDEIATMQEVVCHA